MKFALSQFAPKMGAHRREIEADSLDAAVEVAQEILGRCRFIQYLTPPKSNVEGRILGMKDMTEWSIWPLED